MIPTEKINEKYREIADFEGGPTQACLRLDGVNWEAQLSRYFQVLSECRLCEGLGQQDEFDRAQVEHNHAYWQEEFARPDTRPVATAEPRFYWATHLKNSAAVVNRDYKMLLLMRTPGAVTKHCPPDRVGYFLATVSRFNYCWQKFVEFEQPAPGDELVAEPIVLPVIAEVQALANNAAIIAKEEKEVIDNYLPKDFPRATLDELLTNHNYLIDGKANPVKKAGDWVMIRYALESELSVDFGSHNNATEIFTNTYSAKVKRSSMQSNPKEEKPGNKKREKYDNFCELLSAIKPAILQTTPDSIGKK